MITVHLKKMLAGSFLLISCAAIAQPSVNDFKQAFVKQLMDLKPSGFETRTVKIVQVIAGKGNSGTYSFKVTAYVHDYDEGYAPNKYYGQTCLGKMDNWIFTMHKDDFNQWLVQGRFTVGMDNQTCTTNTAEGKASIALDGVPGTVFQPGKKEAVAVVPKAKSNTTTGPLYIGEYASYGTGNRLMAGMGFTLLNGGRYYDLDKGRGGTYTYNAQKATISFNGGFLDGQTGRNVNTSGFDISSTVHCEPWR